MIQKLNIHTLTLGCSIALLSACGGGDDDNTARVPADAITITKANALDTVQAGTIAIEDAFNALDGADMYFPKASSSSSSRSRHFSDYARTLAKSNSSTSSMVTGISDSDSGTVNCDSGTIKYSFNYSYTETTDKGNGSITFNSCVFSNVMVVGNIKYSYSDTWLTTGYGYNSSGKDSSSSLIITINGESHQFKNLSDTWSYEDNTEIFTDSTTFSYSSPAINGGILVQDIVPNQTRFFDSYPFTGVTLITGANKSKAQITYLNELEFRLEVDEDGDGTFESSSDHAWADYYTTANTPAA